MAEVKNLPVSENLNIKNGNFICGVVEGFYGRPWTTEQRKDLFQKMKKWGMDSYVYAPKDDYKHRAYWRELYTVEEAEHLTGLIQAAKDQNIAFYYALSPGLDITYSSQKEITTLKRKLEQVSQFGCTAFALLFDDIEPEMSEADKEIFQSFAQAQVSITNDIFQHLGQPKFLLCPTQYCSTRAVPNVTNSEYLNTLGSKLAQEIDIMWTGNKVISRILTKENILEITEALRRPPVIWDNLHANDYDQKRVFLGPYSGRSPDLIPKLRGVLTNPNCEYGANFVAIHTLAQWSRCNLDGQRDLSINDTVSADIKLETETEDGLTGEDVPATLSPNMYHPKQALKNAIKEWLPEFSKHKTAWGPIAKPQPAVAVVPVPIIPSINTCMSLTAGTTTMTSSGTAQPVVSANQLQALAEVCSTVSTITGSLVNPGPGPVMNSLVSETKVVTNDSIPNPITPVPVPIPLGNEKNKSITVLEGVVIKPNKRKENNIQTSNGDSLREDQKDSSKDENVMNTDPTISNESSLSPSEPMDCNSTPNISPAHGIKVVDGSTEDVAMSENNSTSSGSMQVESNEASQMIVESQPDTDSNKTPEEIRLRIKEHIESFPVVESHYTRKSTKKLYLDPNLNLIKMHDLYMENCKENNKPGPKKDQCLSCSQFEKASAEEKHALEMEYKCHLKRKDASIQEKNLDKQKATDDKSFKWCHVTCKVYFKFLCHKKECDLTYEDLALFCDLFYLPFEHGSQGIQLLQEFHWLKSNAHVVISANQQKNKSSPEVQEWFSRAEKMNEMTQAVNRLFQHLTSCNNREMLYELYSYVWDIRAVISLLNSYIKWLANGQFPPSMPSYTQGTYTWFSKGWKEAFMSGEQEPWVFRGGLTADLQRLIPVDSGNDLFIYKVPDVPTCRVYTVRPYLPADEPQVYNVCNRTYKDGLEDPHPLPPELKDIHANRIVGPYVTLHPEFCFVIEDDVGVIGYVCAAPDYKKFRVKQELAWIPEMCKKYPEHLTKDATKSVQECISHFYNFKDEVYVSSPTHPSSMICSILPSVLEQSVSKRGVTCLLAALRANGFFGVHVVMNATDSYTHAFYGKLGFVENTHEAIKGKIVMGRTF